MEYLHNLPGGALLVFERVLNENKDGPLNTLLLDLGMLVGPGGRERSAEEYQNLLENNGFEKVWCCGVEWSDVVWF